VFSELNVSSAVAAAERWRLGRSVDGVCSATLVTIVP